MALKENICDLFLTPLDIKLQLLRKAYPSEFFDPFAVDDHVNGLMLEPSGLVYRDNGNVLHRCCKVCYTALYVSKHLLKFAFANDLYKGPVLDKLKDLTMVEECMMAHGGQKYLLCS